MSSLEKLDKVGEKALSLIEKGIDNTPVVVEKLAKFVEDEAPNLASDIIRLAQVQSSAMIAGFLFLCVLWGILAWNNRKSTDWSGTSPAPKNMFFITCSGVLLLSSVGFCVNFVSIIKPIVAPRLYLLEYLTHLVKN